MTPSACVTTSWDDGHPLDLRVAELLGKHGVRGTFYVPALCDRETMSEAQLRELSRGFEIGAHTLRHIDLTRASEKEAWEEIAGSKAWLECSTGLPCTLFSPPKGRYSAWHVGAVRRAGYLGLRTVELLSLDHPREHSGIMMLPTSVQAHQHAPLAIARNATKRAAFGNLWRFIACGCPTDWLSLTRFMLDQALRHGGVFHLWGHSWELQDGGEWRRLDDALRLLGEIAREMPSFTNGEVCRHAMTGNARAGGVPAEANDVASNEGRAARASEEGQRA